MTAKAYKTKFAEPLVKKLKKLVKNLLSRYYKVLDNYHRVNQDNGRLHNENENLVDSNDWLREKNTALREQNRDYSLLRKIFGRSQMDDLVRQARETQQAQRKRKLGIVDGSGNTTVSVVSIRIFCH